MYAKAITFITENWICFIHYVNFQIWPYKCKNVGSTVFVSAKEATASCKVIATVLVAFFAACANAEVDLPNVREVDCSSVQLFKKFERCLKISFANCSEAEYVGLTSKESGFTRILAGALFNSKLDKITHSRVKL